MNNLLTTRKGNFSCREGRRQCMLICQAVLNILIPTFFIGVFFYISLSRWPIFFFTYSGIRTISSILPTCVQYTSEILTCFFLGLIRTFLLSQQLILLVSLLQLKNSIFIKNIIFLFLSHLSHLPEFSSLLEVSAVSPSTFAI